MKRWLYWTGRAFQLSALVALPSAIWLGEFARDERGAVSVFVASIFVFVLGYLLTK